jgi:hypothetical protein
MIKKTNLTLIAALAVLSLSSPALAQSFDSDFGTGNVLSFSYGGNGAENGGVGVQRQTRPLFDSVREHGRQLYDMAPSDPPAVSPNSSVDTGGGSLGYNQMLLIH